MQYTHKCTGVAGSAHFPQGWKQVDPEQAYTDSVFNEKPDVLPAGDSLVLALALQAGKTRLLPDPPEDGECEAPNTDRLGL